MCFKCSSYMFSYWLNLVGIYTSFWNIAILMVNCFMLSENRFQIAISFSRISMYITLWRNVVYCKMQKIFTVCVFQYFHNQIVGCFFINTNNQGFVQQGSSLFFKPICERYISSICTMPSTMNWGSCLAMALRILWPILQAVFKVTPNSFATSVDGIPCLVFIHLKMR